MRPRSPATLARAPPAPPPPAIFAPPAPPRVEEPEVFTPIPSPVTLEPSPLVDITGARVLALLGDSIRSPALRARVRTHIIGLVHTLMQLK